MFCRYSLRTTDVVAGRAFYADALGLELPDGTAEGSDLEAWPLHERAIAQGAPPHWLGHLATANLDAALDRLVALGGQRLGPTVQARDGTAFAVLRDPFGSVIAVRAHEQAARDDAPVVWHQLHTREVDGAWALYHELFGWASGPTLGVPNLVGGYRMFAWNAGRSPVGAMANTARWPGVHTHWLFFLPVADLDAAVARIRALGGTAMDPISVQGMRQAVCEDPQGAAFGLAQRESRQG